MPNAPSNQTVTDSHNGNANGQVTGNERWYLPEDLVITGIINGNYTGAANSVPTNPFGGYLRIEYIDTPAGSTTALAANSVTFSAIPYDVGQQIDTKYDDGVYNTGSIRANTDYTNTAAKTMYWRM
jgi:hypothetical protein